MTDASDALEEWRGLADEELRGLYDRLHALRAAPLPGDRSTRDYVAVLLKAADADLQRAEAAAARARPGDDGSEGERGAYRTSVDRADASLAAADVELRAPSTADDAGYRATLRLRVDAWIRLLQDVNVQLHLAGHDAADRTAELIERARRMAHDLTTSSVSPHDLRRGAERFVEDLRRHLDDGSTRS